ncbi:hypothetical protein [Sulfurirhabdus autotrophica]|uniref:hypothetical protein n=1 Tax=Sulfurirhabdus autotrophica TaxID=1706046 RepID=UPI001CB8DB09|nr:hypothetical protein [Sulfurirhabdus autotrophica]
MAAHSSSVLRSNLVRPSRWASNSSAGVCATAPALDSASGIVSFIASPMTSGGGTVSEATFAAVSTLISGAKGVWVSLSAGLGCVLNNRSSSERSLCGCAGAATDVSRALEGGGPSVVLMGSGASVVSGTGAGFNSCPTMRSRRCRSSLSASARYLSLA